MTKVCERICELRHVIHRETQRFTRNGKDLRVRWVREGVINRVRRRWATISHWEN